MRLTIDNDEACRLARAVAEQLGVSVEEAVLRSLRHESERVAPAASKPVTEMSPAERLQAIQRIGAANRASLSPDSISEILDDRNWYDEHGLPR